MKIITCFSVLLFYSFLWSQSLDLDNIKIKVTDSNSVYYHKNLVEEFNEDPYGFVKDTEKAKYLYYGKIYIPYYRKNSEKETIYLKFTKRLGAKKYNESIKLGENILKKDPINLVVILNLITSYNKTDINNPRLKILTKQSEILMSTIASNGDGKTKETSFKVISLGDEFTLLHYLGINIDKYKRKSEALHSNRVLDIWTKENNYKEDHRETLYVTVLSNK